MAGKGKGAIWKQHDMWVTRNTLKYAIKTFELVLNHIHYFTVSNFFEVAVHPLETTAFLEILGGQDTMVWMQILLQLITARSAPSWLQTSRFS